MTATAATAGTAARRGRSVREQLGIYTLALIAPVLLFAGFLFWQNAAAERARVEGDAADGARTIAAAVDRELAGLFASVDVLSTSGNIQRSDWDSFYRQAKALEQRQKITTILAEATGQQLVNSRVPFGTSLPRSNVPVDARLLATERPFVTDLYTGAVTGNHLFAVGIGIKRDVTPDLILYFGLEVSRLRQIIGEADVPTGAAVAVVDRHGAIMARNLRHDEFVGQQASRDFLDRATDREGKWFGRSVAGQDVFGAYTRSRLSDFRVTVTVNLVDLNAPLWRFVGMLTVLALAIATLSVALGLYFGTRITGPIKALSERAAAVGRGEKVLPLDTGLSEANQVGAELVAASVQRHAREAELKEANEEIQRFAYIVSHDLRSPLVNIMGFTSELEALRSDLFARLDRLRGAPDGHVVDEAAELADERRLGEDFDEAIGFIKASIGKMDRLINAVLRLSREGRREFRPERIDMNALLGTIKASLTHQADAAGATIVIGHLPEMESDGVAVEQIFSNLVDNAVKYLRRGVPGRIEVAGRTGPDGVRYDVRDNGRGIEHRDQDRVFELFRRSGPQDRPGEGIGLAHVRALVRRLGGKISLISEPGQGSTFSVVLPRRWEGDEAQRKAA